MCISTFHGLASLAPRRKSPSIYRTGGWMRWESGRDGDEECLYPCRELIHSQTARSLVTVLTELHLIHEHGVKIPINALGKYVFSVRDLFPLLVATGRNEFTKQKARGAWRVTFGSVRRCRWYGLRTKSYHSLGHVTNHGEFRRQICVTFVTELAMNVTVLWYTYSAVLTGR
jgi:hypothetical protein